MVVKKILSGRVDCVSNAVSRRAQHATHGVALAERERSAMTISPSSATTLKPVSGTDFSIFGESANYEPQHTPKLKALAVSVGADFVGNCFVVHRKIAALHDDYGAEVLTEAGNQGLLPQGVLPS